MKKITLLIIVGVYSLGAKGGADPLFQNYQGPYTVNFYTDTDDHTPTPYEKEEFAQWLHDVRRFQIIFFGAIPISVMVTTLIYDFARSAQNSFQPTSEKSDQDLYNIIYISIGISGAIAIADGIINQLKRNPKEPIEEEEVLLKESEVAEEGEELPESEEPVVESTPL